MTSRYIASKLSLGRTKRNKTKKSTTTRDHEGSAVSSLGSSDGSDVDNNKQNNRITPHAGSIQDLSTLEAAVEDIKSVLSTKGIVSADGIADIINRHNSVVDLTRRHFPAAIGSADVATRVKKSLDVFDVNPENTILTQSVCPDEINHEEGDITDLFIKKFGGGKVFHLGGLAGIPFTGKTGFAAFSHHVPDGGHALILQAPHIGISNDLKLGQYTRA